jgi:hypothetical protein
MSLEIEKPGRNRIITLRDGASAARMTGISLDVLEPDGLDELAEPSEGDVTAHRATPLDCADHGHVREQEILLGLWLEH